MLEKLAFSVQSGVWVCVGVGVGVSGWVVVWVLVCACGRACVNVCGGGVCRVTATHIWSRVRNCYL